MFAPDDLPDLVGSLVMVKCWKYSINDELLETEFVQPMRLIGLDWMEHLTLCFTEEDGSLPWACWWCDIIDLTPVVSEAKP